jgi:glycosyltransferase involved in cell wall biosynthesis
MHILLVADGRSPITQRWVKSLLAIQHSVTMVSSFPCNPIPGVKKTIVLPVAFAGFSGSQAGSISNTSSQKRRGLVSHFRNFFLAARYHLGPLTLPYYGRRLRRILQEVKPDLIHALRIPFEGMLAMRASQDIPMVVSIWGNDLTLHAKGSARMTALTRQTLENASGLLADTRRDLRLGKTWGLPDYLPAAVLPGGGGIDLDEINQISVEKADELLGDIPPGTPIVVNPRGFRPGSVRNDVFFQAIPMVLEQFPGVLFVCPAMQGQPEAVSWTQRLNIEDNVRLLPFLSQVQLWDLFHKAIASVSLSVHDGTPNSLLEAIACGCFPIAGDIESLREWITPGVNGLLVEPDKPQSLAEAICLALEQPDFRQSAASINHDIIRERAEISRIRAQMSVFYDQVFAMHNIQ